MKVFDLKIEYKKNPLGITKEKPRFFWKIEDSGKRNVFQTAYQIICFSDENGKKNTVWDSGKIESDNSVHIEYNGKQLVSGQRVFWRVIIWNNKGERAESCELAYWQMGKILNEDWKAHWITPLLKEDTSKSTPCPFLRKEINVDHKVKSATAYISALGLYEFYVNGKRIGNEYFTPGWTSYHHRIQYQVFDVSNVIQSGVNTIGAILGDGWYRGFLVWQGNRNTYGDQLAFILQIDVEYENGQQTSIVTDNTWRCNTGPILKSDLYNGETYDARLEMSGWNESGYNDEEWYNTATYNKVEGILVSSESNPVKITNTINPVELILTKKNEFVFDLGQNIVGWAKIKLKGKASDKITLSYAEVIDEEGNFYTENLRSAKAEDVYYFKGTGDFEVYEPRFTFHGFRYIKVSDYPYEISIDDICGQVVHTDMEPIGEFECDNSLINRLQKNIQWGLRGNFLDVPTDCPQRDERLGWTGDSQVFAPTACFNMNTAPFFTKWMKDFIHDQKEDGSIPWVVPNVIKEDGAGTGWSDGFGATGWADAAVIIPWVIYQRYGDLEILRNQYNSMRAWVEYMIHHAGERYIFDYGFHFGDWLSFAEYSSYKYNAPDYGYAGANTAKDLIATAYFYYSTNILQKTAKILGNDKEAKKYSEILPQIKTAFQHEFITPAGRLISGTQTAYALTLAFGILPKDLIGYAAIKLANDVKHFEHITTGFLGTPLICFALSDNGYQELAYQLLFNDRYPSWLYAVKMGATTIWERWDGIKPDGSFQTAGMNSFNHYAYGAIGDWLYSRVAGLSTDEKHPGYKKIIIKPLISRRLKYARANHQSLYGEIMSFWELDESKLTLRIKVPVNTNAIIYIPKLAESSIIYENQNLIHLISEIKLIDESVSYLIVEVGSGNYSFNIYDQKIENI